MSRRLLFSPPKLNSRWTPVGCWLVTTLALLGTISSALPSTAQPQPDQHQQELGAVRREISRLQEQVGLLNGEERSRSHELTRTEIELQLQRARLAEARKQQQGLRQDLQQLSSDATELGQRVKATESVLIASAQRLQGASSGSALRLLTTSNDSDDLNRVRWLRYLVGGMNQRRQRLLEQKTQLAGLQTELESREIELAQWVQKEEDRNQELTNAHRRQRGQLSSVKRRRDQLSTTVATLVDRERRLGDFISLLQGRSFADQTPIQRFRGILDAPVSGGISKGFGPQLDPRYKTKVPHNGVEYALSGTQTATAIYSGEVVFAATFQGFGLTVIIAHPNNVFSLYAGLYSLRVSKGDVVALQQPIGSVQGSLYFEIRLENRPQDPINWVR